MTTTPPTLIRDPWRRLWHIFTSDGFLIAALTLVAALLVTAALLPQTPSPDPVAYSRWLSDARTRFGNFFDLLNSLGLFTITTSLALRLSLALLGFAAALRIIDVLDRLRHATTANRAFTRRSGWAALMAYAGWLSVLLGLLIGNFSDIRVDNLVVLPGALTAIPGTPYTLRLDTVDQERATVALLRQTETIAQGEIAQRQPLHDGISVYLAQVGPALNVSAAHAPTETLQLQSTATSPAQSQILLAFTPNQNDAFVAAPQVNLVLRVSSAGAGEYVAQVYQSATGKDLGRHPIKPGDSLAIEGTTFSFQPAAYIIVSAANQPSHWIIALGLILTTLGLGGAWLWPSGAAATRSDRAAQTLGRVTWLIGTALVWGQLIIIYPLSASLNGLTQPIENALAAWLLFSGGLITHWRARWWALLLGAVVAVSALAMLLITLG